MGRSGSGTKCVPAHTVRGFLLDGYRPLPSYNVPASYPDLPFGSGPFSHRPHAVTAVTSAPIVDAATVHSSTAWQPSVIR